jgi:hypothetical protein
MEGHGNRDSNLDSLCIMYQSLETLCEIRFMTRLK